MVHEFSTAIGKTLFIQLQGKLNVRLGWLIIWTTMILDLNYFFFFFEFCDWTKNFFFMQFLLRLKTKRKKEKQTWNHFACLKAARASRQGSRGSWSSIFWTGCSVAVESKVGCKWQGVWPLNELLFLLINSPTVFQYSIRHNGFFLCLFVWLKIKIKNKNKFFTGKVP